MTPCSASCRRSGSVWWCHVHPDTPAVETDLVMRQCVAADQRGPRREVEFPVVPVAGQHAAIGERTLAQRIALMRTAIGAGEHAAVTMDEQDLPAFVAHDRFALRREFIESQRIDPGHVVSPSDSVGGDAIGAASCAGRGCGRSARPRPRSQDCPNTFNSARQKPWQRSAAAQIGQWFSSSRKPSASCRHSAM